MPHHTADPKAHPAHAHARPSLIGLILARVHDTELWANYLPRLPASLYALAGLGLACGLGSVWLLRGGQIALGAAGLVLAVLLGLPLAAAGLFARWRWRRGRQLRRLMLDAFPWRGDEWALDVGCGNGLLLNGIAQRLTSGRAVGIDLWVPHGGGGTLDLLRRNARLEKVEDRIVFEQADARQMPYPAGSFDVVVSSGAIHHIARSPADLDRAMHEMLRVLKPGGRIVIADVAPIVETCAARMRAAGLASEVRPAGRFLSYDLAVVYGRKAG